MFSDLIGHDFIRSRLIPLFQNIGEGGTFLFYGPPSVGKRTFAFEVGRVLLCETGEKDGCFCKSCNAFKTNHPDFFCIGREEKIKIEDVDGLIDFSFLSPLLSNRKVAVLDNIDNMTWEASNRLLKILEEPPKNLFFFLVTSNPKNIIPTILSRCIKHEFGILSQQDLTNIIWKKMNFELSKARMLAWVGEGSGIDIFSYAGKFLTYKDSAHEFLQLTQRRDLLDLIDYIDRLDRRDLWIFVDMLLLLLTDILFLMNGIKDIVNSEDRDSLKKLSLEFQDKAVVTAANYFSQVKKDMNLNINMLIATKNALIKSYPLLIAKGGEK